MRSALERKTEPHDGPMGFVPWDTQDGDWQANQGWTFGDTSQGSLELAWFQMSL